MRLRNYLYEAHKHIAMLKEAKEELQGADFLALTRHQRFAVEIIIFRFSKLQDLLGQKIFRAFLEERGFITQGVGFDVILKELEKEGIVDIDSWGQMRELRNVIAHEYPYEEELQQENFLLALELSEELITILERIERAVNGERAQDH